VYVYIISAGSKMHKIGISKSPKGRLNQLQTSHYRRLRIAHQFEVDCADLVESFAHRMLSQRRVNGEWFSISEPKALWAVEYAMCEIGKGNEAVPTVEWPTLSDEGLCARETGYLVDTKSALDRRDLNAELYRRLVAPRP
jgi:hypothetical protein